MNTTRPSVAGTLVLAALLGLCGIAAVHAAGRSAALLDLSVRIEPANGTVEVEGRISLAPDTAPARVATLALGPRFEVLRFELDGEPVQYRRAENGTWTVGPGHEVRIAYRGGIGRSGAGQGMGRGPGGGPMIDPRGSFLAPGSGWLISVDGQVHPYRLALDVPAGQRTLVPGRLVSESTAKGRYGARFESEWPRPTPVLLAGPYEIRERMHGSVRLRTYFDPSVASLAEAYLDDTARYLDRYSEQIGPYPFSAFHVVSSPLPTGLGFTNLTYIGARVLRLPFIRGSSLAHEVLHSWWGNGVFVDYAGGNWSEGLTTYLADYALVAERGPAAARRRRLAWLRDFNALPKGRDAPAARFVTKTHDASQVVGYGKVAFFFHMLQVELGEEAFRAGLARLWSEHRFQTADWADLRRAFEAASGRQLKRFFDQWLRHPGAPGLDLEDVQVARHENGYRVDLTLVQNSPAYALRVPIALTTGNTMQAHHGVVDGRRTRISLRTDSLPARLAVDPDFNLFRRLAPGEAPPILRDVTLADSTGVVLPDADSTARQQALALATRLLDTPPKVLPAAPSDTGALPADRPTSPLLIAGTTPEVTRFLADASLPAAPAEVAGLGSARVWTARDGDGRSLLVIAAKSGAALAALTRALPHYGRRGYLVFEGPRVIRAGDWPPGGSALTRSLTGP